jgi:hypothetical protein
VVSWLAAHPRREDEWYAYKLWAICVFQGWLADCHRAGDARAASRPAAVAM